MDTSILEVLKPSTEEKGDYDDGWIPLTAWETESEPDNPVLEAAGGEALPKCTRKPCDDRDSPDPNPVDTGDKMDFMSESFQIKSQKILVREAGDWKEPDKAREQLLVSKLCADISDYELVKLLPCCKWDAAPRKPKFEPMPLSTPKITITELDPIEEHQKYYFCYCNPWKRTAARYFQLTFAAPDIPPLDEIGECTNAVKALLNMMLRLARPPRPGDDPYVAEKPTKVFLTLSSRVVRSISCLHKSVCDKIPQSQLQRLNDSFETGIKIEIPLITSQTMQEIFSWYLDNPTGRDEFDSYCTRECTNKKIQVKISVAGPSFYNDIMCFRSYRKYMLTHFITKCLGKSGYDVLATKLPQTKENENVLLIQDVNGKDSTPHVLRIGEISSPDVSGEDLELFRDLMKDPPPQRGKKSTRTHHEGWKTLIMPIFALPNFTFNYDILCRPTDSIFNMHLPNYFPKLLCSIPRGLYSSYNRVYAILKIFKDRVEQKLYEPPPDHCQTWAPSTPVLEVEIRIIQMLFDWPAILASTIDVLGKRENIQQTLVFMKEFNDAFESFYLNHPILLEEPSKHRIIKMYDQLYLLKIVATVYLDFFELLLLDNSTVESRYWQL